MKVSEFILKLLADKWRCGDLVALKLDDACDPRLKIDLAFIDLALRPSIDDGPERAGPEFQGFSVHGSKTLETLAPEL